MRKSDRDELFFFDIKACTPNLYSPGGYELRKYRTRKNALQISSAWEIKFVMRM